MAHDLIVPDAHVPALPGAIAVPVVVMAEGQAAARRYMESISKCGVPASERAGGRATIRWHASSLRSRPRTAPHFLMLFGLLCKPMIEVQDPRQAELPLLKGKDKRPLIRMVAG